MEAERNSEDYDRTGRKRSEFPIWHMGRFHPDSMGAKLQAASAAVVGVGGFVILRAAWRWIAA